MAVQVTLSYVITPVGPISPADLLTKVAAVPLPISTYTTLLGVTQISDVTAMDVNDVRRTIVLDISGAAFQAAFPVASGQAAPFVGLFTQVLAGALNMFVTADPPALA